MHQNTGARSFPGDNPNENSFLVLLSRRNHMSTAKTQEIDLC